MGGGHVRDASALGRADQWDGVKAVVAGFGVSGIAAVDNLLFLGADVTALDERENSHGERADLLESLGAKLRLGPGSTATLPDDVDVVVTSPGWRPDAPLLAQATARGIPVWGEVELAWRLRDLERPAPWLAITGTNGKTTTVQMLDSILRAAGKRSLAVGNVGTPIVEAVMDPTPYDALAVELSSFQLHWTSSMRAESAAVLNLAEDHLDWYDGADGMSRYAADKARIFHQVEKACVYNVADPVTEQMVVDADVVEGARAIGFTLGMPAVGMLGLVEDILVDRAFIAERATSAAELLTIGELASDAPTSWPTRWPRLRWRARTVSVARRWPRVCGASAPTATGSRRSRSSVTSPGSTTRRRPTRTPPSRRCRPTSPWSGWRGTGQGGPLRRPGPYRP